MSANAKSFLPLPSINIEHASLERLALLEQVQKNNDFLLSIYAEDKAQSPKLQQLKEKLDPHKYGSFIEVDSFGRDVLRLHYVGKATDIATGFTKLGAIGGMFHAANKIMQPISELSTQAIDLAKYSASEPARLLSVAYLFGDFSYASAGDNKTIEGKLMNLSGFMAIAQSLIYIGFARDGSEYEIEAIQKRMNEALLEGKNPMSPEVWAKNDDKSFNLLTPVLDFVKKHPIETGACAQMLGQVAMVASGAANIHFNKKSEGWMDIARGLTSITAWGMLQLDAKEIEEKTAWSKNPVARLCEEIQSSPHKYASSVNVMASLFGIRSSLNKIHNIDNELVGLDKQIKVTNAQAMASDSESKFNQLEALKVEKENLLKKRPNAGQIRAELMYLAGDATMFFAEKASYGEEAAIATKGAAKAAAHLITDSQMLMGNSATKEFAHDLAQYLAARIVAEQIAEGKIDPQVEKIEIAHIADDMAKNIFTELAEKPQKSELAANLIARISNQYPQPQQIQAALIDKISTFDGVDIDIAEMQDLVTKQHQLFASNVSSKETTTELIAKLTTILPIVNAGINANELYQTMIELKHTNPQSIVQTANIAAHSRPELALQR